MYQFYGKINRGQVSRPWQRGCPLFGGSIIRGFKRHILHNHNFSGCKLRLPYKEALHFPFHLCCKDSVQQQHGLCIILLPISACLLHGFICNIFTSLYTMTLLIVRSWIVHLTPLLGCSYHLHSHFLSTWGVVMLEKKNSSPLLGLSNKVVTQP